MPSNASPILSIYVHIRIHIHISSRTTGCGSFNGAKQILSVGNRAKLTLAVWTSFYLYSGRRVSNGFWWKSIVINLPVTFRRDP